MKRLFIFLFALVLPVLLVTGCENKEPDFKETHLTFTDSAQRSVSLPKNPERVAVLFSSYAEMVLLAGGSVDVTVGESVERGFADADTPLVDKGAGKSINAELLLAQRPDFVIGSYDIAAHRELCETLDEAGVTNALFRVESFEDYASVMKILCQIFDSPEMYRENVVSVEKQIKDVLAKLPQGEEKKNILFIRCASGERATKAKDKTTSFVCRMLDEMNTHNIASDAPLLLEGLSIEHIIMNSPDFIFFSTMGDEDAAREYMTHLLDSDEWQAVDCVKNKNYAFLPKELFQYKPNGRWHTAYRYLAELLYGEIE